MKNPLLDKEFLIELDNNNRREVWAKIISLTFSEQPVEEITGKILGGNISIDGSSAVRRTCSLSMITEDVNINNYLWGLNTKFRLEIGLTNDINPEYPEIIWFKQGIFVITQFNTTHSINNYTISIQGQDKMCLLNGTVGGSLTASVDFGKEEYYDIENDITTITDIPIKTIIKELVHQFAKEPWHNIIINDLDEYGIELLDYRGKDPMYMFIGADENNIDNVMNITFKADQLVYVDGNAVQVGDETIIKYDPRVEIDWSPSNVTYQPTLVSLSSESNSLFTVAKIEVGQTAGYRLTDLIYAGDLIGEIGEPATAILDKIKQMLGNFEYFYDIDGRFIFQKKRIFVDTSWNNIIDTRDQTYVENAALSSAVTYQFEGNNLISSFANSPQLNNLKNDYSLWGTRKSVTGKELPVHYRFAIDRKPKKYVSYDGTAYTTDKYDWRELIYQMAKDYRKYNHEEDFLTNIIKNNLETFPTGYTGYEQYYTDMEGFWRQLYNPFAEEEEKEDFIYDSNGDDLYWAKTVFESPEMLNFWFDFLAEGELEQFSNSVVGNRPKAVNDNNIKSIYFKKTPTVLFYEKDDPIQERKSGYTYMQIQPSMKGLFNISSQGKSAKDVLDENIYNHAYCIESVSLSTIPIYYLEPNTRIFVRDDESGVYGDYIMTRLSIPLGHSGAMSISATKAAERIY